ALRFADPEGLAHELVSTEVHDEPLIAEHPEVPAELALEGFHAARAYGSEPEASRRLLEETLGFEPAGEGWEARGERRGGLYSYDEPPREVDRALQGAGTVHHIAWASSPEEHGEWRERIVQAGVRPAPGVGR